jgi:hypothetical protein
MNAICLGTDIYIHIEKGRGTEQKLEASLLGFPLVQILRVPPKH